MFVRALYVRGDESIWEPAAEYHAVIAESMAETGASYAAMGLFSTAEEDGALEAASLPAHLQLADQYHDAGPSLASAGSSRRERPRG